MDDKFTQVTLSNVVCNGVSIPAPGSRIMFTGAEECGIEYESDHRGYALIHTARPMRRAAKPVELLVTTVEPTSMLGWMGVSITCSYSMPLDKSLYK